MTSCPAPGDPAASGGGSPQGGGASAGGRSPGRRPSGSVPSMLASLSGRTAERSIRPAAMTSPYRSDSLTESGTANCPLPHSPSMHSGGSNATSSTRPSPTNSPFSPSSFRIRDCISGGAPVSLRWHFRGQMTRLRSTTNSGRSPAFVSSVALERTSPSVANSSESTPPVYVLCAAPLDARSRCRIAGDTPRARPCTPLRPSPALDALLRFCPIHVELGQNCRFHRKGLPARTRSGIRRAPCTSFVRSRRHSQLGQICRSIGRSIHFRKIGIRLSNGPSETNAPRQTWHRTCWCALAHDEEAARRRG